ncbi:hypothetical protein ACE14D_25460 [Streptomyces sp. Act-28]
MGPPQLLFADEVDGSRVALFHDGLRAVRYAEPKEGVDAVTLDFARTDGADTAASAALVVSRTYANVRYLTAPWVRTVTVRDLLLPDGGTRPLERDASGVTAPMQSPAAAGDCRSWDVLEVRDGVATRVLTDLGEPTPVRLTSGPPTRPADVTSRDARREWAGTACLLPSMRALGVRSVNSWRFAEQELPGSGTGTAAWLCTRAETWRGPGSRVLAQFQAPVPDAGPDDPPAAGAVAAKAEDSPSCGTREPHVLAGVVWKDPGGRWYVLAAGSPEVASLATSGGVEGDTEGRLLTIGAERGVRAELTGRLRDGRPVEALR